MSVHLIMTNHDEGHVYVGAGIVTCDEIVARLEDVLTKAESVSCAHAAIFDFSQVERMNLTTEDIVRLARLAQRASNDFPHAIIAIVAPQDAVYGHARMWQAYLDAETWSTCVFRTLAEAQDWRNTALRRRAEDQGDRHRSTGDAGSGSPPAEPPPNAPAKPEHKPHEFHVIPPPATLLPPPRSR